MIPRRWSSRMIQQWVRRDRILLALAAMGLALAALLPWYRVPPATLNAFHGHLYVCLLERLLMALLSAVALLICLYGVPSRVPRLLLWIGIAMVVLFPFFVTTFHPNATYIATDLLKQQQEAVGHLELNFPEVQSQWKQQIKLHVSVIIDSITPLTITTSRFFQISSFQDVFTNGLGFRNSFFGLVGQGWGIAFFGLGCLLIGCYVSESPKQQRFQRLQQDLKQSRIWCIPLLICLCILLFLPSVWNSRINRYFALGQYPLVVRESQWLQHLYPPFSGDTQFIGRLAYANHYINQLDEQAAAQIYGIEAYAAGDYELANRYFSQALQAYPQDYLLRGYTATTRFNQAVIAFNQSRIDEAIELFTSVLDIFPMHVNTLYTLMVAYAVNGEHRNAERVAHVLTDSQQYFQLPSPSLTGQALVHRAWNAFHQNDLDEAWHQHQESKE